MRFSSHSLFPIVVMAFLAALTFWLERATEHSSGDDGQHRHDPDFVVEQFAAKKMGTDGMVHSTMTGARMVHYPDDDSTAVTEPRLNYASGPSPIFIQAQQASISKDGKEVVFTGQVQAWRNAQAGNPKMSFTTPSLTAYPDDEIARTKEAVTLQHGRSEVTAQGLELDNKLHVLSLLSQVRSSLQPRK